jgi:bifunctional non-homologous end joining protein LigD
MTKPKQYLEIEGRKIAVSNLEKVLYPAAHFTKGQVIDYYVRVAPYILPYVKDRPVTMKRFPDGVKGEFFYEKNAPSFTPHWVRTFAVPRRSRNEQINYILINDLPTLVWSANLTNLEIHPFLHRVPDTNRPTHIAFDLDPGEGAGVLECAKVALLLRDVLKDLGLESFPKVSGSKGLQMYVPLNTETTYDSTQPFAHALAQLLEERYRHLVVSEMPKRLRSGKVFIDWSQNSESKTTVGVYSLRAKSDQPYVSMPVEWEELSAALEARDKERLYWGPTDAFERIEKHGDLFASVLRLEQKLPQQIAAYFESPKLTKKARKGRSTTALRTYEENRDFSATPEPRSAVPHPSRQGSRRRFVIQKHAASHLHYDFRLEMHDALKSWAVPKGPPYEMNEKRLAMPTEDHPIEYLDFEGVIPKGQYGGGTVMVWDIGTYELMEGNYYKGFLHIYLDGKKLKGEWALMRSHERGPEVWILTKVEHSTKPPAKKIENSSALSGRSMEQIAARPTAAWESNRSNGSHERVQAAALEGLPRSDLKFVEPMLAKLVAKVPDGPGWSYEIKWDGYRALVMKANQEVTIYSRRGNVLNQRFGALPPAFSVLEEGTMIDGEIVAMDEEGRPSFNTLQNSNSPDDPVYFYAFDLLAYAGKDTRTLSLTERRRLLEVLAIAELSEPVRISNNFPGGPEFLAAVKEHGLEGVVAKRSDSRYEAGERTGKWLKYKTNQSQELVVGGYIPGTHRFESLLIGYYERPGQLMFIGKLRNGFTRSQKEDVAARFKGLETRDCPFANLPEPQSARRGEALTKEVMKKCRWLTPKLVVQVEFTDWTTANHLRHSRFAGLRDDKEPGEVTREGV